MAYLGLLLTPIIGVIAFLFGRAIHKQEYKVYAGFLILSFILIVFQQASPEFYASIRILDFYSEGYFAFACYTLLMFIGVIPKKSIFRKKLMQVRRELAIVGFIAILPHAFMRFSLAFAGYNSTGLIAFMFMVPLVITSFPHVRKQIKPADWLRIHRLAYLVYGLLYIHLTFNIFISSGYSSIALKPTGLPYLVVFILYALLRLNKQFNPKWSI